MSEVMGTTSKSARRRREILTEPKGKRAEAALAPAPVRRIDPNTERAARAFLKRLEGKYAIVGAILFGSRARGNYTQDSDADIAVVLKGTGGAKSHRTAASLDMAGFAFDVMMETGVMVQGLPLWETELARPDTFTNPALINNILREGVHL